MNEKIIIPLSIIIAGLVIGFALYSNNDSPQVVIDSDITETSPLEIALEAVNPVSDHIFGSPAAELFVIEYSDLECPFCKKYHDEILGQLKSDYAEDDRVAFVFRHFPLDEPYVQEALHPTAQEEHIAAECVAKLAGNEAFFSFIHKIFSNDTPDDLNQLGSTLSLYAQESGVNQASFDSCYRNQDSESVVKADFEEGLKAGVQGTPTVFIQTKNGKTFRGEADYNVIKTALSAYLSDLK